MWEAVPPMMLHLQDAIQKTAIKLSLLWQLLGDKQGALSKCRSVDLLHFVIHLSPKCQEPRHFGDLDSR